MPGPSLGPGEEGASCLWPHCHWRPRRPDWPRQRLQSPPPSAECPLAPGGMGGLLGGRPQDACSPPCPPPPAPELTAPGLWALASDHRCLCLTRPCASRGFRGPSLSAWPCSTQAGSRRREWSVGPASSLEKDLARVRVGSASPGSATAPRAPRPGPKALTCLTASSPRHSSACPLPRRLEGPFFPQHRNCKHRGGPVAPGTPGPCRANGGTGARRGRARRWDPAGLGGPPPLRPPAGLPRKGRPKTLGHKVTAAARLPGQGGPRAAPPAVAGPCSGLRGQRLAVLSRVGQ